MLKHVVTFVIIDARREGVNVAGNVIIEFVINGGPSINLDVIKLTIFFIEVFPYLV